MRPEEIDYSDTRKHYFDLSNGEVLAGADDRKRYIEAGAQAVRVVELGSLLRDPTPHLDPREAEYEKMDTSKWSRDRFLEFTRWIGRIVPKPADPHEKKINKSVLWHAYRLGLGPGVHAINKEVGSYTNLYHEAGIAGLSTKGLWKDWGVDDAVGYIKRVGGDKRPSAEDLRRKNKQDPGSPTAEFLTIRFREIGGFSQLTELAGYTVVQNWSTEDYIEWGVKIMRANDGKMPTRIMLDYLSVQDKGPHSRTVAEHFDDSYSISSFQREVARRFYEHEHEASRRDHEQIEIIDADLHARTLPILLFSPFEHKHDYGDDQLEEIAQAVENLYGDRSAHTVVEELGVKEAITRYAKFKVVSIIAPLIEDDTKIAIARGGLPGRRTFESAIRKVTSVSASDIEYVALTEGLFDYIWSDEEHIASLRMDSGYRNYLDKYKLHMRKSRAKKKSVAVVR